MQIIQEARQTLRGQPEQILSVALIAVGLGAIGVALFAGPLTKAAVLAWLALP